MYYLVSKTFYRSVFYIIGLITTNRKDNMKKINKNDLSFYFITDHKQLPDSYLKSCNNFFNEIKEIKNPAATYRKAVNNLKRKVK